MTRDLLYDLSVELGLGRHDLSRIIGSAPKRYKVYQIPKRRGGSRTIAQPSRELKAIQRIILRDVLSKLPVHRAASGYVKGRNIADNARTHVNSKVVLKLDFQDFFPSIRVRDWERYARSSDIATDALELRLFSRILFWGRGTNEPRCLSIGAPTSPILSNILLFDLDKRLFEAAKVCLVSYTRYADDITVSAGSIESVTKFEVMARSIVRRLPSPRLIFNDEKRGIFTKGQRRLVTGLVLTPTKNISIGRGRKRLISAMLHRVMLDTSDVDSRAKLKGLLGFCIANEPSFIGRMRAKYGNATIDSALSFEIPRRSSGLR
ncbi:retron St85 family RNA-directed DNA polymerase [Reyranella sp.]|uniref:retron St85 family RNA-directed DNA polymerase n=1 Tax=Reyranella sp. TaxID=1929291 RepID=UPI0037835C09